MTQRTTSARSGRTLRSRAVLAIGACVAAAAFFSLSGSAMAANSCDVGVTDKTWTGASSTNWFTAGNWSPSGVPSTSSDVCIPTGTPNAPSIATGATANAASIESSQPITLSAGILNVTSTTQQSNIHSTLTIDGGATLQGAGAINVDGTLNWDGQSTMTGTGTTTVAPAGTVNVNSASTGFDTRTLKRTLTVNGTGTWSGDAYICADHGGTLAVGGTLSVSASDTFQFYNCGGGGADPQLHVLAGGSMTKSGAGTNTISIPFDNDGTTSSTNGTLDLSGGTPTGGSHSGTWSAAAGDAIEFNSSTTNSASSLDMSGAGALRVNGGATLNLTGAGEVHSASTLALDGSGVITGAGNLNVDGTLNWDGQSTMTGTGTTTVAPAGTVNVNSASTGFDTRTLKRTLTVNGTGTWSGDAYICADTGGTLNVAGTLSVSASDTFQFYNCGGGGADPQLHVLAGGSMTKSGAGTNTISIPFDNDGTTSSTNGTLDLSGGTPTGGSDSGTWSAAAGDAIEFNSSTTNSASSLDMSGAGALRVNGGATLNLTGAGEVHSASTLALDGSGVITGAGNLNVDGTLNWDGQSTMSGAGTTTIASGGGQLNLSDAITGSDTRVLQRTMTVNGTASWSGNTYICADTGGTLNVAGTLSVSASDTFQFYNCGGGGAAPQLHVLGGGTMTKSGAGTNSIFVPSTNDGTIAVSAGKLDLQDQLTNYDAGTQTLTGGAYATSGAGKLQVTDADVTTNAASLSFANSGGLVNQSNQSGVRNLATNAAAGRLELTLGKSLSVGALTNNGEVALGQNDTLTANAYTQSGTGTLTPTVNGTNPGTNAGHLVSNSTASLAGTLHVISSSLPNPGDSVDIINSTGARTGTFATVKGGAGYDVSYNPNSVTLVATPTLPSVSIGDGAVVEGNAGTATLQLPVTRSGPTGTAFSVKYKTLDSSATAPGDYTSVPLTTLNFSSGEVTKTLSFAVQGDTVHEGDENFLVNLSSPTAVTIADNSGKARILDDEGPLSIYAGDTHLDEGNAGTTNAQFTVSLTQAPAPGQTVGVHYATADGKAKAPGDYDPTSGDLIFNSGTGASQVVNVPVHGDTARESNEKFKLKLSAPSGAILGDKLAIGTIRNDDVAPGPAVKPSLYISDATVLEPDAGTVAESFTVSLSEPSASPVTVNYSTANDTATTPGDYTAVASAPLTFAPGEVTKTATVNVQGDTVHELTESYKVRLTGQTNAVMGDRVGAGTILDNEGPLWITVDDPQVVEGDSGSKSLTFTLRLPQGPAVGQGVNVDYATADDTATAGSDYTAASGTVTFNNGTGATRTVTVPIAGDTTAEPDETLTLNLSTARGGVIADTAGTGTIRNDD